MTHPERLTELISAALGEPIADTALVELLDDRRVGGLARLIQYRIATERDAATASRCRDKLGALAEDGLGRLLRAPALCQALTLDEGGARIEALIDAELNLQEGRSLDRSPRLACGVPIDLSLPVSGFNPAGGMVEPRLLDTSEMSDAVERCDRALAVLREVNPISYAAFSTLESNLVLRADAGRSGECWGNSSNFAIGRLLLCNPASAGGDALLAEHLLHETVHTAIACAEVNNPLLHFARDATPETVASAWTGNRFSAHTLVHAVAVWAVLLDFWQRCRRRFGEVEGAAERIAFIEAGFARLDLGPALSTPAWTFTAAAKRVFDRACANGYRRAELGDALRASG